MSLSREDWRWRQFRRAADAERYAFLVRSKMSTPKLIGIVLVLLVLITGAPAQAPSVAKAQKLIELPDTNADNEMAYLDLWAEALGKNPSSRGYLVGYSNSSTAPGTLLMRIYGYRDYLVNKRGVEPNRLEIVPGGVRDKLYTEFWLVTPGAEAPKPESEFKLVPKLPLKFDVAYPDCPPEMTVYLYEINDSLRFYAKALQANPQARAKIVTYYGKGSMRKANRILREAKSLLVKDHKISADRILIQARTRRRPCSEVELWLMPVELLSFHVTHNKALQPTAR